MPDTEHEIENLLLLLLSSDLTIKYIGFKSEEWGSSENIFDMSTIRVQFSMVCLHFALISLRRALIHFIPGG